MIFFVKKIRFLKITIKISKGQRQISKPEVKNIRVLNGFFSWAELLLPNLST